MHHISIQLFAAFTLMTWCSYASAQSCSIYFTSPAKNSVLRTPVARITGSGSGQAKPTDQGSATATLNGDVFFAQTGTFTTLLQFLGSGAASVTLREGRNNLAVQGSVNSCSASDAMRLFHVPPDDKCYTMVEGLDLIPQPVKDPTNGFVVNQRCIAKYSCGGRQQMQDPAWLEKVVPAFVTPFLKRSGEWEKVVTQCRRQSTWLPQYVRERRCEWKMADYHIEQDLQGALNANGCGTPADWDEVGDYINECVAEQNNVLETALASQSVIFMRNRIRKECVKVRGENALLMKN